MALTNYDSISAARRALWQAAQRLEDGDVELAYAFIKDGATLMREAHVRMARAVVDVNAPRPYAHLLGLLVDVLTWTPYAEITAEALRVLVDCVPDSVRVTHISTLMSTRKLLVHHGFHVVPAT